MSYNIDMQEMTSDDKRDDYMVNNQKLSYRYQLRFTPEQALILKKLAKQDSRTLGSFIRVSLNKYVIKPNISKGRLDGKA